MLLALFSTLILVGFLMMLFCIYIAIQFKIEERAIELFDELMEDSLSDQADCVDQLWGFVRSGHARRKRVEKILKRERDRAAAAELEFHEQVWRMAIRHGEVLDDVDQLKSENQCLRADNQQLSDNNASLVDDVMTKLLGNEQVPDTQVDVAVSRLRRRK